MICPYCHAQIEDGVKYCTECGRSLQQEGTRLNGQLVSNTGMMLGQAARRARLEAVYTEDEIISDRAYNAIMVGVVLWGLLVNVLLCVYVGDVTAYINPVLFLVLYFVCALAGVIIAGRSRKPLVSFLGYNLVVLPLGLVISSMVAAYGGAASYEVANAFVYTMLITLGMAGAALAFPRLFDRLGGALLGVMCGLLLCEIVLLLLRIPQSVTDWLVAGLFSLYIGYDVHRSQQFAKTLDNAVDCALDIYLDIANLFIRLLRIMGRKKD